MTTLEQRLRDIKIVPVIAINDVAHALPLAKVLVENGLPCAEVTFRTEAAAESIRIMREAYPELLIGAGASLDVVESSLKYHPCSFDVLTLVPESGSRTVPGG